MKKMKNWVTMKIVPLLVGKSEPTGLAEGTRFLFADCRDRLGWEGAMLPRCGPAICNRAVGV